MEGLETSDDDQRGENNAHEEDGEEQASTMSENPVGDELKTEQKQKEQEEDEKDKLLSLSEEEQPPDEEDDALLNKEKSFIFESRMEDADLLRKRGNENLGNNLLQEAETDYRRGLFHLDMDLLQETFELHDEHRNKLYGAQQPIKLNLCQCIMKQDAKNRASEALELADEVLQKNAECAKAWFWRGKAKMELGKLSGAKEDLIKAEKLAPQDKLVMITLQRVKVMIREENLQTGSIWQDLFQKSPMPSPPLGHLPSEKVHVVWTSQRFIVLAACGIVAAIFIAWVFNI